MGRRQVEAGSLKIAVVNATPELGGAGIMARDVARGMASRGHTVRFISTAGRHRRPFAEDNHTTELVTAGAGSALAHYLNPRAMMGLWHALDRFGPDVVNVHNINLRTFSAASLWFSRRFPMAWTMHDVWPVCVAGWPSPPDCAGMHRGCRDCPTWPDWQTRANRVVKDAVFSTSRVTVVPPCQWMADTVASGALGGCPTEVIPYGVDPDVFRPDRKARSALEIDPKERTILFCGGRRVSGTSPAWRKGWSDLIGALWRLSSRKDLRLIYAGDPLEADIPIPTTFTGPLDRADMPAIYAAADLCVLPTLGDNSPVVLLEAMAAGTAIVASRVGGIPEVLEHDKTALLVPARDPMRLAEAMGTLLDDPLRRKRMGKAARAALVGDLTLSHMLDRYERLFERLKRP